MSVNMWVPSQWVAKYRRYTVKCHERAARKKWFRMERKRIKYEQAMMLSQRMMQQKMAEQYGFRGFLNEDDDPDTNLNLFLPGESLTIFLQNEEFMAEIRWKKNLLSNLDKDKYYSSDSSLEQSMIELPQKKSYQDENTIFKEPLRNMRKASRKKIAQLARIFTGRHHKKTGDGEAGSSKQMYHGEENLTDSSSKAGPSKALHLDILNKNDDHENKEELHH